MQTHFTVKCPRKISLHNQQMFLQNEGLPILGNKPIELFNEQNDGLGNSSVNPYTKSRNGGRVIRGHQRGKNRKPSDLLKMSPTNR